jgi:hypothetical protein
MKTMPSAFLLLLKRDSIVPDRSGDAVVDELVMPRASLANSS